MSPAALIGSYSERTTCPHCGDRIRLEDVRIFVKRDGPYPKCPACGASLRVSIRYERLTLLACFAVAWLIPYLIGLRTYALVAWIPFYLLAVMLLSNLAKVTIPPKLQDAEMRQHRSLLRRNFESFMSLWLGWSGFVLANGGISAAIEGKPAFYFYLSSPLGWFASTFVVRNDTTTAGKVSIFLANSFTGALFFFPLSMIFHTAFRHSHVTQLAIYSREIDLEEKDDDE